MMTPETVFEDTRHRLRKIIEATRKACGSTMRAYKLEAQAVGAPSARWIRKVLGRQDGVTIHAHTYENIKTRYARLFERIEHGAACKSQAAKARVHFAVARIKTRLTARYEVRA